MGCISQCNDMYFTDINEAWTEFQNRLGAATDDESKKQAIEWWETRRQEIYLAWLECLEECSGS